MYNTTVGIMLDTQNSSPPVAFALTLGAGAATWLGAAVVFIPAMVQRTSPRVLAVALGLSAGVLAYVSMIDIFGESYEKFVSAGISEATAYIYTTICFFGGAIAMKVRFILYIVSYDIPLFFPPFSRVVLSKF